MDNVRRPRDRRSPNFLEATEATLIGCYVLLAAVTAVIVPIFDAPDEPSHFAYTRLIAQGKGLPVQTDPERRAEAEGFNPPLYYLIDALLLAAADPGRGAALTMPPEIGTDWDDTVARSWRDSLDATLLPPRNPNFEWWEHGREPQRFLHPAGGPLTERPLIAVKLMRLLSVLCGMVTLLAVSRLAACLLPERPALRVLAVAVVALNPQFIFISATLNSDNMVTTFATLTLWRLAVLLRRDRCESRDAATLGLLLGLGLLSKPNMLFLGLPVAIVVAMRARSPRAAVGQLGLIGGIVAAVAGWYFVRNAAIYGNLDFLGWKTRLTIQPHFAAFAPLTPAFVLLGILRPAFDSYWGWFGWMSLRMPSWHYVFYAGWTALAALSWGKLFPARRRVYWATTLALLWGCVALNVLALVTFNVRFFSNQGRLLFPSIGAMAVLIALGFDVLTGRLGERGRLVALTTGVVALLLVALRTLLGTLYPAYL